MRSAVARLTAPGSGREFGVPTQEIVAGLEAVEFAGIPERAR